jgi:long-chain acyl-CoA synthetase
MLTSKHTGRYSRDGRVVEKACGRTPKEMQRIHELLDRWTGANAGAPAGRTALVDHDGTAWSYSAFGAVALAAANRLTEAGVRPGDRIVLVAENCVTYAAMIMAASRLDAWVTLVNGRTGAMELDAIRDHARPRAIVFTPEASPAALAHATRLAAIDLAPLDCGRVLVVPHLEATPEPVEADAGQVAALLYTTGTTGAPKGVMLTHGNLIYVAGASAQIRAMTARDRILGVLPGTHIFALASAFLAGIHAGARIDLQPRFQPQAVLEALADGVTVMPAVPQMYAALLQHLRDHGIDQIDTPALRYISAGGAPLDPDWKRRVEAVFGLTLHNGYGMTEASPSIAATRVGRERTDISVGELLPGQEAYLAPPPGADALADGVGELMVRGPNVMKGYYRNPQETARTLTPDGYLHTGDLARYTDDGAIMIVGRCKELIIRSGFNVYPPEVEAALNTHPDVTQSAVVGRAVPGNEEVLAFVQSASSSLDEAMLKAWLADRLAPYKCPARIIIAPSLPVAATGKVVKARLVENFAAALAAPPAPPRPEKT